MEVNKEDQEKRVSTKKKPTVVSVKNVLGSKQPTKRNVEQQNRLDALNTAVNTRMTSDPTEKVLASAQQYFNFLQGVVEAPKPAEVAAQ